MYTLGEKIVPRDIEEEIKDSYLSYAMSVIIGRALPDARDGLKPVHRRILYAMQELGVEPGKPYKKSARIVGEVLGKYHPHGDVAVYDTLVRLVQDFSLRYPLVDGQGNFGSVDGDAAAAMRYTEARLSPVAMALLNDLDKDTVEFAPNFDASLVEPKLLPAALPNLLVNGSSGIAVGMATNIPPHNLGEIVDALCAVIDKPEIELPALMRLVQGPDFPTGAIICGRDGIKDAYATGRGSLRIRAKAQIEQLKGNRQAIVITELPYQVNKANLIESIAKLVQEKTLEGISDLRDESDKEGMRVVIELKRDANDQVVLNQLFKHTTMESTFGVIMLSLVDGRPRVLGLKPLLQVFIDHRREIVTRRTKFELAKARERAHILEGLRKALSHLDAIIKLIKQSKSPSEAREALVKKFEFTERQAQAILEMQLQRLTALERDKIEAEYKELLKKIDEYEALLKSEAKLLALIKEEFQDLKKRFGDERRTEILGEVKDFKLEDLIAEEDVVITISHTGYIKRLPVSSYRKQKRGGVGVTAMETKEEDFVEHLFVASTHETLLFFTNMGRCYWLKVHEVPQASRYAKGTAIANLLQLQKDEGLSTFVAVKEFVEGRFVVMATKHGTIKRTSLDAYSNPRKGGIIAITLEPKDALIEAEVTDGKQELALITKQGKAIRFPEAQAREVGRSARGVRGISLGKGDEVISMAIVQPKAELLTVTTLGFGKRSPLEEYRVQSRGGKGVINIKVTSKNGEVIGAKTVTDQDEVMLITHEGMMVRSPVKDIRSTGRAAQGVRLIHIKGKDRVASVAAVVPKEKEEAELPPAGPPTAAPRAKAREEAAPGPAEAPAPAEPSPAKAPAPPAARTVRSAKTTSRRGAARPARKAAPKGRTKAAAKTKRR
jgi:DNA gyrase subunit A